MRNRLRALFFVLMGLVSAFGPAWAQSDYPSRPIRLIIPFAPGTSIDALGRLLGISLGEELNQSVVVENRAGASGIVGAESVSRASPDGYTLLLGSSSVFSLNPIFFSKLPYDPVKSFTPITRVGVQPMVVVSSNKLPVKTLQDLIAMARAKPATLNSATLGSFHSLVLAYFASATNTRIVDVPYKSSPVPSLIAGEVDMMIDVASIALAQSKAGQVRALAITSAKRSPEVPDLPTLAELGYPGFEATTWTALVGPPGMPDSVVQRLNQALRKVLSAKPLADRLASQAITLAPTTGEQLAAFFQSELDRWKTVAREAGIVPQ